VAWPLHMEVRNSLTENPNREIHPHISIHMNNETETTEAPKDLSEHVETLRHDVGDAAQAVKDKAGEKLQDATNQIQVSANDVVNTIRGFVKERPFTLLGIGVLLGLFLAPRRRA
jgi:ElaB/YqjD/DUF883 family membrane-anchored ribosome-binding protein